MYNNVTQKSVAVLILIVCGSISVLCPQQSTAADKVLSISPSKPTDSWTKQIPAGQTAAVDVVISTAEETVGQKKFKLFPGSIKVSRNGNAMNGSGQAIVWTRTAGTMTSPNQSFLLANTDGGTGGDAILITCIFIEQTTTTAGTGGAKGSGSNRIDSIGGSAKALGKLSQGTLTWTIEPPEQFADGAKSIVNRFSVLDTSGNPLQANYSATLAPPSGVNWSTTNYQPGNVTDQSVDVFPIGDSVRKGTQGVLKATVNGNQEDSPNHTFFWITVSVSARELDKVVYTPAANPNSDQLLLLLKRIEHKVTLDPVGAIDLSQYTLAQTIVSAFLNGKNNKNMVRDGTAPANESLFDVKNDPTRGPGGTIPQRSMIDVLDWKANMKTELLYSPYPVAPVEWGWHWTRIPNVPLSDSAFKLVVK